MKVETVSRFAVGALMIILFASILLSGKKELIVLLLTSIQIKVFHELRQISLTDSLVHLKRIQIYHDWYLFLVFLSLALVTIYSQAVNPTWYLGFFMMYTTWFILWVLTILNVNIKRLNQYLLHASWIHLAILYTAVQPVVIDLNIANGGSFWFLFPCSLVICNDTAAYICGRLMGKRSLLRLSPNKTVEGFVGACFVTIYFGYTFSSYLLKYPYLFKSDLETSPAILDNIQFHGTVLATFSSLVAPFGGYFASATKRAGKVKDFGDWIPGHGGVTDRVDCQLFMAVFTYVYFKYINV